MTQDFAGQYRQVTFFGIWADESADDYGTRDAMAIIREAVMQTYDEDMRTADVTAALDYLAKHAAYPRA